MAETSGQARDDADDWSQISNKVLRKRVQNRLAQRNYRKGIKVRLNELERLATREGSPAAAAAPATTTTTQPPAATAARDSPTAAKGPSAALRAFVPDLPPPDVPLLGGGFALDGSAVPYSHVSASPGLALALPVMRDVALANPFPVPEWAGDGKLSPTANLLAQQAFAHHPQGMANEAHPASFQSLAGEMDGLGKPLDQHRHGMECYDVQSYAKSSTSSGVSDRPSRSAESSTVSDRMMLSNPLSAHENESSMSALSTRTPLSQHSSGVPSGSIDKDRQAEMLITLSSRIASAMATIRSLGFSDIEDLTAQFYTADLQDRPALADAQRISRRRGLTRLLAKLREHAKDNWTEWEAQGYREEIVRAAEDVLGDECRQFSNEEDAYGSKRGKNIAELKRQFQEELPNLYGLLSVLSSSSQQWGDADNSIVIVHAIISLLRGPEC